MGSLVRGGVAGLAGLAGLTVFVVGLPAADPHGAAATAAWALPDELPGGLVPQAQVAPDRAELIGQQEQFGAARLEELYGVPAEVRAYATEDRSAQVFLTVVAREPGVLLALGPPYDPQLVGQEHAQAELTEVDGAICASVPVPAEQRTPDGPEVLQVECQTGAGGLTFDVFAVGVGVEDAAAVARAAADGSRRSAD